MLAPSALISLFHSPSPELSGESETGLHLGKRPVITNPFTALAVPEAMQRERRDRLLASTLHHVFNTCAL